MRQDFSTASTKFLRSSSLPKAVPPTVPGHTGATSEPTFKPLAAIWSAMALIAVGGGVGVGVRMEDEEVDAVELAAVDLGGDGQFEHAVERDRRVVGSGFFSDQDRATWRCAVSWR